MVPMFDLGRQLAAIPHNLSQINSGDQPVYESSDIGGQLPAVRSMGVLII